MNLITDPWLPIRRRDGGETRIALQQLAGPELVDLAAPRADFTAALFQLGVALLQIAMPPDGMSEWRMRFETPPSAEELQEALAPWRDAFELNPENGPAFFQDLDPLQQADPVAIDKLLIDTPGDQTVTNNNDLFLHAGAVQRLCPACAAAALLTLQINAPAGGAGHRVSVRGGGPLTTLRLPRDPDTTLFQKLWMNVVPAEVLAADRGEVPREHILPWLTPTRTSDPNGVGITTPEDVHCSQSYFSMPRRIRLDFKHTEPGDCDLCGEHAQRCVMQYRTRPYGTNYAGYWLHPLTPYVLDAKQDNLPLSMKGQRGGVGYRHWLGLAVSETEGAAKAATVVTHFNRVRRGLPAQAQNARLWCCGYDMDNMKARCWYDATLPLPTVDEASLPDLIVAAKRVLDCAGEAAALVRKQVGEAGHADAKESSTSAVAHSFWHGTERSFYRFLDSAMNGIANPPTVGEAAQQWLVEARETALRVFDTYALSSPLQEGSMEPVVAARAGLERALYSGKSKALWEWGQQQKEAE